ncbi:E3 ubiquitin-protein ligase TRIM58 isoform X2 [Zootoca vivipara]|uniref:E3 ubiquitin-protein ligase TRIM58 isoform X2 n=1 Tax=Zootoca vivipara TaxID=8524 RepID=UPI00293C04D3|nr:E3 ubiquitin-protein ligase TRIM58 isoform X2 [Zootoca vivipara]
MASSVGDPVERLQEEVSCSICLEYLRDPVTIECGHNFCQACISNYCERGAGSVTQVALCPQCRAGFLLSSSRPNKQLANIVEGIERLALRPSRGPGEALCEKHGKKLRLFCQDDGEPICLVCDKSREHRAHTVLPIEEAAHDYKTKLREAVDVLRKVLGEASKLEAQEAEKTAQWKDIKVALTRSEDVSLQRPQPISMDLQDLYDVPGLKESLQRYSVPVTFDPDTANPYLLLSDNQLCVQVGDQKQDLPKSLSRFETCTCLLGCQQFTTGRHYWEVCVESKTSWTLGVCRESVSRQGIFTPSPATGFWTVWLRNGNEYAALTSPLTELALRARPGAIGIFLDYDAGEVSFYNADNGSHIFTFADSFSGPLRPYFYPGVRAGGLNDAPLIIQPARHQGNLVLPSNEC